MNIERNLIAARARFMLSLKMYFRYPLNILQVIVDPIIWLTPFYFMGKAFSLNGKISGFASYMGNSDYIGFLVIGYMVSAYVNVTFWNIGFSLKDEMMQGVLESNWSAPVNRINLLLSRSIFSFVSVTVENIITGVVSHFAFGFNITPNLFKVMMFLLPGIAAMLGFGLMIASLVLLAKQANGIIDITSAFLSAVSGGYFPLKVMPRALVMLACIFPLTYINDSARNILINQASIMPLEYELLFTLILMVVFCVIGSMVFTRVERKCRETGNVSGH